jgi:hypothetical protein
MNKATKWFIKQYKDNPVLASMRINMYAMLNQNFDSKLAANTCGLEWTSLGYKVKR